MKKNLLNIFIFAFSLSLYAQIPAYYNTIDFSQTGDDLKHQLTALISNTHTTLLPYTSGSTDDTWHVLKQSDLESNSTQDVVLIYGYNNADNVSKTDRIRNKTYSCHSSSCIGLWNREHVYPKSIANPRLDTSYPSAGTDAHNLRTVDSQMNSSRSNRLFAAGSNTSTITAQGNFFPGEEWKGDVARIIMYMYLRYPTQCLANDIGVGANSYSIDMPDVFLKWNAEDPVSEFEIQRNNIIADYQGNRNPFIDNPYLATLIWDGFVAENTWGALSVAETTNVQNLAITVYPNPVTTTLYVKNDLQTPIEITVYSIDSKVIQVPKNHNQIDVSALASGIYFLNLTQENYRQTIKFIKN